MLKKENNRKKYKKTKEINKTDADYSGIRKKLYDKGVSKEESQNQASKKDENLLKEQDKNSLPSTKKPTKKSKKAIRAVAATIQIAIIIVSGTILGGEASQAIKSDVKSNERVWKEAELLDIDTDIIALQGGKGEYRKGKSIKLPHNGKNPIYIAYSDKISSEDKKIYQKALDYYEELFKDIDGRYRFQKVSKSEAYIRMAIGQSVILFDEKEMRPFINGYALTKPNFFSRDVMGKGNVSVSSSLNDSNLKYSVIIHEMAHVFGLGDGHFHGVDIIQSDSFMFASNLNLEIGMLYPNDIKLFHLLYNRNLSNNEGVVNQAEAKKIDDFIKEYEEEFYDKVTKVLHEKTYLKGIVPLQFDANLSDNPRLLQDYIYYYDGVYRKGGNLTTIDFENNKINYKILSNENKVIYETDADIVVKNDIIFIPSLSLEQGPLPEIVQNESNRVGDNFYAIYKDDYNFIVFDFSTGRRGRLYEIPETMEFSTQKNAYISPKTPLTKTFNNAIEITM